MTTLSLPHGPSRSSWAMPRWLRPALAARASREAVPAPAKALAPSQTVWLDTIPGTAVACVSGCLWLTYDGQQRDIVLSAGARHVCDCQGRLAVHALGASRMQLE